VKRDFVDVGFMKKRMAKSICRIGSGVKNLLIAACAELDNDIIHNLWMIGRKNPNAIAHLELYPGFFDA
jgi:hypothetical protein